MATIFLEFWGRPIISMFKILTGLVIGGLTFYYTAQTFSDELEARDADRAVRYASLVTQISSLSLSTSASASNDKEKNENARQVAGSGIYAALKALSTESLTVRDVHIANVTFPHNTTFENLNFVNIKFQNVTFPGITSFKNTNLSMTSFDNVSFKEINFSNSHLLNVDFKHSELNIGDADNTTWEQIKLHGETSISYDSVYLNNEKFHDFIAIRDLLVDNSTVFKNRPIVQGPKTNKAISSLCSIKNDRKSALESNKEKDKAAKNGFNDDAFRHYLELDLCPDWPEPSWWQAPRDRLFPPEEKRFWTRTF